MAVSSPTPLDVAASIDRVLRRNIQWPLKNVVFADSPVTVTDLDRSTMADASGGAIVVNLPDATLNKGMFFEIKKTDISANTVTIACTVGGQTIDGAGAKVLVATNDFIVVESDGANYKITALVITPPAGGGAVFYTVKKIVKTDGVGAYVPIPGTLIAFTVAVAGECSFWAAGRWSGFSPSVAGGTLNFRIDGVDYAPLSQFWNNGAGGDFTTEFSMSPHISLFLGAGPHTVELVGSATVIGLAASPAIPLTLSVLFPAASFDTAAPTPKAATLVVHPVPGVGDYTTIAAALAGLPAEGGYILVREGTYAISAENVIPDKQVEIVGCGSGFNDGQGTVIDLGANAINAFRRAFNKHLRFAHLRVRGDGVAGSQFLKADSPDTSNFVDVEDVVVDNLQKCLVTDPGFMLLVRAQQLYFQSAVATPKFWDGGPGQIEAVQCEAANGSISGVVDISAQDSIFLLDDGPVNAVGNLFAANSIFNGEYAQAAGRSLLLSGSAFLLGFGAAPARFLDIPAGNLAGAITGCRWDQAATEEVRNAGNRITFKGNSGSSEPRITETGAANFNIYDDISLSSTILGAKTLVNGENLQTVAVDTVLDVNHRTVNVDASLAARTITLPTAASAKNRKYIVKKIDASLNTVTIDPSGAETIDGAALFVLTVQYQSIEFQSDGTAWWIV
jgi:hypothetical protein